MSADPQNPQDNSPASKPESAQKQSDTSSTAGKERWWFITIAFAVSVLAWGTGPILILMDSVQPLLPQIAFAVGSLASVTGVVLVMNSYRYQSEQRHQELLDAINELDTDDGRSDIVRALRRQQELVEELLEELPEQQEQMEELADSLPQQNELIQELIQEEISSLKELQREL